MELKVNKYYLVNGIANHWFGVKKDEPRVVHIIEKRINPTTEIQTQLNFPIFPSDFNENNLTDDLGYFLNDKNIIEQNFIIEEADPEEGYYFYEDEETGHLHLGGKDDNANSGYSFIREATKEEYINGINDAIIKWENFFNSYIKYFKESAEKEKEQC